MSELKDQPFIAILTKGPGGEMVGKQLPVGFMWVIHESAIKEVGPMGVVKISLKHLDTKCLCGNPYCTLKIRWRAEKSGHHPDLKERSG